MKKANVEKKKEEITSNEPAPSNTSSPQPASVLLNLGKKKIVFKEHPIAISGCCLYCFNFRKIYIVYESSFLKLGVQNIIRENIGNLTYPAQNRPKFMLAYFRSESEMPSFRGPPRGSFPMKLAVSSSSVVS